MPPTALVTLQLDGWPPPTIEIHALLAALPQHVRESQETPPNAIQHLNEVVLTFHVVEPGNDAAVADAQETARAAIAAVYQGQFHVVRARIT